MTRDLLYIDGYLVNLEPDTPIAQTIKCWSIGELRTTNSNYTNKIKLKNTPYHRMIFGIQSEYHSFMFDTYKKKTAKLVQGGSETIRFGTALLSDITPKHLVVEIYSGIYGFFDTLSDKTLSQLDMSAHDSGGAYVSSPPDSADFVQPWVDFGQFDINAGTMSYPGTAFYSFRYKKIIQEIILQNGYTYEGDVFNDDKFNLIFMSALGFGGLTEDFRVTKEFDAYINTAVPPSIVCSASYQKVNFTDVVKDAGGWYDGVNTYTVNNITEGTLFICDAFANIDITVTGGTVDIRLYSQSGIYLLEGLVTGLYNFEISDRASTAGGAVNGATGTTIFMEVRSGGGIGTPTVTFNSGRMFNRLLPDIISINVPIQGLMPKVPCKDILKDFFVMFGIIPKETDDKKLICKRIKDIIKEKHNAVDWSKKRVFTKDDGILPEYYGFAKNNYFEYSNQDKISTQVGRGNLIIDNDNLPLSKPFYKSLFNSCETLLLGNVTAGFVFGARIKSYDGTEFDDPGYRLLLLRNKRSSEPTAGGVTNYKVGYFDDPQAHSLSYERILEENYAEVKTALNSLRFCTLTFNLDQKDIESFDQHRLVYDQNGYYLVDSINKFVPGELTKVKALKVV